MTVVCYDLDDTLTAAPDFYRAEMAGHHLAGHGVHVLSAVEHGHATQADYDQKRDLLRGLGLAPYAHELAVVNGPHDAIPTNKIAYLKHVATTTGTPKRDVHLVDNRKANVRAAHKAGFTGHHHMHPKGK